MNREDKIRDAIDNAHGIFYTDYLVYVWHGGTIVNIYHQWSWGLIDCFNSDLNSYQDFVQSVHRDIEYKREEMNSIE